MERVPKTLWRGVSALLLGAAACGAVLIGFRAAASQRYEALSPAAKVEAITADLRAPGDPSTVATSSLGLAFEIREEVATDVDKGLSRDAILRQMEQRYGPQVLAVPRFAGFGVLTWVVPAAMGLGVLVGVVWFVRRSAEGGADRALRASGGPSSDPEEGSDGVRTPEYPASERLSEYL
ncbi:MAG: cytochrome c-type biogenesis protein CcmH [Alicyclobacillus sp.]|nr:cytochrome c-type biogenesis protein CcmH [Alicyclobacillus sp.]